MDIMYAWVILVVWMILVHQQSDLEVQAQHSSLQDGRVSDHALLHGHSGMVYCEFQVGCH